MVDWPLRSVPEPPTDRRELPAYLDRLSDDLSDLIANRLSRIVRGSYRRFIDSMPTETLTATGDFAEFDDISIAWLNILDGDILPAMVNVYTAGSLGVILQAADRAPIPPSTLDDFFVLLSNNAVEYAQERVPTLAGIGQAVASDVRDRVVSAIEKGTSPDTLRREIGNLTNVVEYRADAIARTEVGIAWNTADYQSASALGEFGPVEKVWRTRIDGATRDSHIAINGTRLKWNEQFLMSSGTSMRYPQDPFGIPAEIINCRCYMDEYYRGDQREDGSIVV